MEAVRDDVEQPLLVWRPVVTMRLSIRAAGVRLCSQTLPNIFIEGLNKNAVVCESVPHVTELSLPLPTGKQLPKLTDDLRPLTTG